jgi:multiple antibiotic resistance protein
MVLGTASEPSAPTDGTLSVAIFPVATPIIAGPGSLLTMVLLMNNQGATPSQHLLSLLALGVISALLLATFLMSEVIQRIIGTGGANLLRRVMGLLLSALAVNMVLSALALWLRLPSI